MDRAVAVDLVDINDVSERIVNDRPGTQRTALHLRRIEIAGAVAAVEHVLNAEHGGRHGAPNVEEQLGGIRVLLPGHLQAGHDLVSGVGETEVRRGS